MFPRATAYRMPKLEEPPRGAAKEGAGAGVAPNDIQTGGGDDGGGAAWAASLRRQLADAPLDSDDGGDGVGAAEEVAWYCREGASALQVSPPPGSAVLFW